jgi:hypothetical protein
MLPMYQSEALWLDFTSDYPFALKVATVKRRQEREMVSASIASYCVADVAMGLAPGGRMRQEIYDDPHQLEDWDTAHGSRCFLHLANALVWRSLTGEEPPPTPATAAAYTRAGLPWFEYYAADQAVVEGSGRLKGMRSVVEVGKMKGDAPLPENESAEPANMVQLRKGLSRDQVREGAFQGADISL